MTPSLRMWALTVFAAAGNLAMAQELVPVDVVSPPGIQKETGQAGSDLDADADLDIPDGDEDELDSLLDLVDDDVSKLSSVNVSRQATMAPALNTEVTTVSRQKSTIGRSPAAVFVISNEMIRHSGARTIPDVLRMAPGVQVSQIDASEWAVSIRGSNGRFANKLLVQIDGRTVYTPLFGGTFWDVQDLLFEDIERIEVVRGPGAAVWGANAVNGVINIITKNAKDTHGTFVEAGAGTEQNGFTSARHGWRTANGVDMRVYGKWFDRDEATLPDSDAHDDWRMARGGFRADWKPDHTSHLTFQGDAYGGESGRESLVPTPAPVYTRTVIEDTDLSGFNGLLRYSQTLNDDNEWSIQAYFDHTYRQFQQLKFGEKRDSVDIDFQHQFKAFDDHSFVWGASYRNSRDHIYDSPFFLTFDPDDRTVDQLNYFVQDEITLIDDALYFTTGAKFTHSDYTPFEFQPTARILWTPNERQSIWASYSRAVRSPTRVGIDVSLTMLPGPSAPTAFPLFLGNRKFASENMDAWEIGMRAQPTQAFSWDAAAFYFDYDDLQAVSVGAPYFSLGPPAAVYVPLTITNSGQGRSYGFELGANYALSEDWRLYGAYTFLREQLTTASTNVGGSPDNQIYLQSSFNLTRHTDLDVMWRYSDSLPLQSTPSYNTMDVRYAWRPSRDWEVALVGRNLLQPDHKEVGNDGFTGNVSTNIQREFYAAISLWY
ncbi:Colicin I receptor precursor [Rubripirellula lacrimiformis]|uniref:Colicin I receptor n=1 Tax=Rubripirellula lacrimiformis TaxID=1930273 RepID=A0A517NJN0_9BACT|nr:TonB-dependent receptor [Rubripirellula lacrimiformis]QDT07330.1 Colicin I receptor precursor [Rubripirellula lacrimiformis]